MERRLRLLHRRTVPNEASHGKTPTRRATCSRPFEAASPRLPLCVGGMGVSQGGDTDPGAGKDGVARRENSAAPEQARRFHVCQLLVGETRPSARVRVLRKRCEGDGMGHHGKTCEPCIFPAPYGDRAARLARPRSGRSRSTDRANALRRRERPFRAGCVGDGIRFNRSAIARIRSQQCCVLHVGPRVARNLVHAAVIRAYVWHEQHARPPICATRVQVWD